jgi:hypothetical protein
MLSASRLYSFERIRAINECGAIGGIRTGMGKRIWRVFLPITLCPGIETGNPRREGGFNILIYVKKSQILMFIRVNRYVIL